MKSGRGLNLTIWYLAVFLVSLPFAFYYFIIITISVSGRLGDYIVSYIQKYKSKLEKPFYLGLVLLVVLIAHYTLGKSLTDIVSSGVIPAILWLLSKISTKGKT